MPTISVFYGILIQMFFNDHAPPHFHVQGVFAPLKDPQFFNQVFIHDGIISWPGEIDLAPDAMYSEIKQYSKWILH